MKRNLSALVALVVLLLAALSISNAASLELKGAKLSDTTVADRCTATAKAAPTDIENDMMKSIVLSGIDVKCVKKSATFTVYDAQGKALSTVQNQAIQKLVDGKITFKLAAPIRVANTEGVALTIGTWGIATTYTKPVPLLSCSIVGHPEAPCTVSYTRGKWSIGFGLNNVVANTTPKFVGARYKLTVNFSDPWFVSPPDPMPKIRNVFTLAKLAPGMSCQSMPIIDFFGPAYEDTINSEGRSPQVSIGGTPSGESPASNTVLDCR